MVVCVDQPMCSTDTEVFGRRQGEVARERVCVRGRVRVRERESECASVCVKVFVRDREGDREEGGGGVAAMLQVSTLEHFL